VSTLRDELRNLEDIGLLDSSWEGNIKYYTVNQDFIIYPELKSIIFKTQSVGKVIGDNLRLLGEVKAAFVYGSFAKGEERLGSDIDLMIVGRVELLKLNALISSLEDQLRRSINYLVFTPEELDARKREGDEFIADILAEPKIMLIGDENEL
jgi:predicted nucleotidyltransferase